ncbi:Coenzyme Q-binding protein COQ10 START domain-containing protein [Sphingomonas antarctica]|uniref:SRPBCC family protein n=1 Tax=Sphingomonas antarctica TaxID=2040274 RepID=UPI0039ED2158
MSDTDTHDDAPNVTSKDLQGERQLASRSATINRPAQELYAFWRNFSNLAQIMDNIVSIEMLDETRSHWVVKGPAGQTYEWDALVTNDVPGREITWTSDSQADVANSGRILFEEVAGRGTVVTATIAYEPPMGALGKVVVKVLQREPHVQARRDLRRFKQLMETGEIATNVRNRRMLEEEGK